MERSGSDVFVQVKSSSLSVMTEGGRKCGILGNCLSQFLNCFSFIYTATVKIETAFVIKSRSKLFQNYPQQVINIFAPVLYYYVVLTHMGQKGGGTVNLAFFFSLSLSSRIQLHPLRCKITKFPVEINMFTVWLKNSLGLNS